MKNAELGDERHSSSLQSPIHRSPKMKTMFVLLTLSLALPVFAQEEPEKKAAKPDSPEALAKRARKLEHELVVAHMKLELARLDTKIKTETAEAGLAKSDREAKSASDVLHHFDKVVRPTRVKETHITLDAAKNQAEQAQDEYNELVAMYKAEEFAEMTKELVLKRGRHTLDLAKRRLDVQAGKLDDLRKNILPRERAALTGKAQEADSGLRRARLTKEKTKLEIRIAMSEAEHSVVTKQSDLAEVRKKLAKTVKK